MFEVPVKKSAYAETHVPLQRKIVPIAHEYKKEDIIVSVMLIMRIY